MKQKMSVTRALVELKRLDDRINQAINTGLFVGISVGRGANQKPLNTNDTVQQVTGKIQASYDKVTSLVRNREVIKAAIVQSNANTRVTLMGRDMSVAEAIELKSTVTFRQNLLAKLRQHQAAHMQAVEVNNAKMEESIQKSLDTVYGSEKSKVTEDLVQQIAEPQRNQKEAKLIDPCDIAAKIQAVEKDISDLTAELDFTLSEINARTEVEVDLSE